ncbi:MAG: acetolactate synthase small subunit [Bacillota bacterium]
MDNKERTGVFSMLVTNEAGVAARLTALYARRGYNIDSFTASPTNDPHLTRITLVLTGDDRKFNQIFTQTAKQEFVKSISLMEEADLYRELLLLKIKASKKERSEIKEIVDIYRGRIVDLSNRSLIVEVTGESSKIDGFMNMMSSYELVDVCRTGITGLKRGDRGLDEE